jgi:hypothetical protein
MRYQFLLLALVPAIAHAEDGEIIVTGRALPDARGDAAYSSVIIDRDRLNSVASAARTWRECLKPGTRFA